MGDYDSGEGMARPVDQHEVDMWRDPALADLEWDDADYDEEYREWMAEVAAERAIAEQDREWEETMLEYERNVNG